MQNISTYEVIKTTSYGLESWILFVFYGDNNVGQHQFHSEQGALNKLNSLLYKGVA